MNKTPDMRVIGIGSHHGADATGWLACELLSTHATSTQINWQRCRNPLQLPELIRGYHAIVIIDAIMNAQPPGHVVCLSWPLQLETYRSPCSSHALNVIEALQLAETLGQLPALTFILGISVSDQQQNASPVVHKALPHLQHELARIQKTLAC